MLPSFTDAVDPACRNISVNIIASIPLGLSIFPRIFSTHIENIDYDANYVLPNRNNTSSISLYVVLYNYSVPRSTPSLWLLPPGVGMSRRGVQE